MDDKTLATRLNHIDDVTAIAVSPGNALANDYMRGMANGLILAQSIMKGDEPAYIKPHPLPGEPMISERMANLERDVAAAINRNSLENGSNTPDHILAEALTAFLPVIDSAIRSRELWYGRNPASGPGEAAEPASPQPAVTSGTMSDFAVLDVKAGRDHFMKHFAEGGQPLPVIINGLITGPHSRDDGTSIEFSVDVKRVTLPFEAKNTKFFVEGDDGRYKEVKAAAGESDGSWSA